MTKKPKLRCLQFSLKSLLLLSMFSGLTIGWFAHKHREHRAEQKFISDILDELPSGMMMSVTTNGQTVYPGGIRMM